MMLTPEAESLLTVLDLRPIFVPDLGRDALLIHTCGLVLIDYSVALEGRMDEVLDRLLSIGAEGLSRPPE